MENDSELLHRAIDVCRQSASLQPTAACSMHLPVGLNASLHVANCCAAGVRAHARAAVWRRDRPPEAGQVQRRLQPVHFFRGQPGAALHCAHAQTNAFSSVCNMLSIVCYAQSNGVDGMHTAVGDGSQTALCAGAVTAHVNPSLWPTHVCLSVCLFVIFAGRRGHHQGSEDCSGGRCRRGVQRGRHQKGGG